MKKEQIGKYLRLSAKITTIIAMSLMGILIFPIIFGFKTLRYIKSLNETVGKRDLKRIIVCFILVNPTPGLLLLIDYFLLKDDKCSPSLKENVSISKSANNYYQTKSPLLSVLLSSLLIIVSLSTVFPAGMVMPSTLIEDTSEYIADIGANHTTSGQYVGMVVEPKDGSDKKVNNPYNEFHYLYGIFHEGLATYIGSRNADKSNSIKIKDFDDDVNYSILNVDSGFDVKKYYVDKETGETIYKQEFYPLELMFYSNHPAVSGAYSFLYLSKSRADKLLDKKELEHTRENYKTLLNTLITVDIDGTEYKFAIDNIYFEKNYFAKAINEVMGEFLLAGPLLPNRLKKQALFFLRNYSYQNKYYIEYATKNYPQEDFKISLLTHNINEGFSVDQNRLVFYSPSGNIALSILLVSIGALFLFGSIIIILLSKRELKFYHYMIIIMASLVPYCVFWIIHAFTDSVLLFSNFSTICEIVLLLVFFISLFIIFLIRHSNSKKMKILYKGGVVTNE